MWIELPGLYQDRIRITCFSRSALCSVHKLMDVIDDDENEVGRDAEGCDHGHCP